MIRVTLHMTVKPGRAEEFERTWRTVAAATRQAPGNLRQALLRDPDDPAGFIITSDWESREDFTRFERSPEQDDLTAPLRALRASARMSVAEVIAHVDGQS